MAANATRVIDDLGPLNRAVLWLLEHESFEAPGELILARANYITQRRKENAVSYGAILSALLGRTAKRLSRLRAEHLPACVKHELQSSVLSTADCGIDK
jgi:hypothetical protein